MKKITCEFNGSVNLRKSANQKIAYAKAFKIKEYIRNESPKVRDLISEFDDLEPYTEDSNFEDKMLDPVINVTALSSSKFRIIIHYTDGTVEPGSVVEVVEEQKEEPVVEEVTVNAADSEPANKSETEIAEENKSSRNSKYYGNRFKNGSKRK